MSRRRRHSEGSLPPLLFVDEESDEEEYAPNRDDIMGTSTAMMMATPDRPNRRLNIPPPIRRNLGAFSSTRTPEESPESVESSYFQQPPILRRSNAVRWGSFLDPSKPPLPRTFDDLRNVMVVRHEMGEECPICMDTYSSQNPKVIMHGNHEICKRCMSGIINAAYAPNVYGGHPSYELVGQKISCPYCRTPVRFGKSKRRKSKRRKSKRRSKRKNRRSKRKSRKRR